MDACEWRLDAYKRWLTMREPDWARVTYPKIDFPRYLLLRRAEGPDRPESRLTMSILNFSPNVRETGHSAALNRRSWLACRSARWRSTPFSIPSRW